MSHNIKRAERMRALSDGELKARVDRGSLSSEAAAFELKRRGIAYVRPKSAWEAQRR